MLIDLGKVTKETRTCTVPAITKDAPLSNTYVWYSLLVGGTRHFCKTKPSASWTASICPSATPVEDCDET